MRLRAARDLVDLVDEHDAVLFDRSHGCNLQILLVDELRGLLFLDQCERILHLELASPRAALVEILEQALELVSHLLHAGRRHDLDADGRGLHVDLDLPLVEGAFAQHLAEALARVALSVQLARPRQESVEQPVLSDVESAVSNACDRLLARHLDGHVDEIAHDGVDVAADVTHFGELRSFHLDERGVCELGEPPRDLGLADAGGADHENILRRDLAAQRLLDLRAAPAIAQRDRDRALCTLLADDVPVQLLDDLARRHRHVAQSSSTVISRFV